MLSPLLFVAVAVVVVVVVVDVTVYCGLVNLQWHWVRGHSRVEGNEAADKLAKRGSAGERLSAA